MRRSRATRTRRARGTSRRSLVSPSPSLRVTRRSRDPVLDRVVASSRLPARSTPNDRAVAFVENPSTASFASSRT
jgi:hypothetical protein